MTEIMLEFASTFFSKDFKKEKVFLIFFSDTLKCDRFEQKQVDVFVGEQNCESYYNIQRMIIEFDKIGKAFEI